MAAPKKKYPEPYTRSRVTGSRVRLGADNKYHATGVQSDALWAQGIGQTRNVVTGSGIGWMTIGTTNIVA